MLLLKSPSSNFICVILKRFHLYIFICKCNKYCDFSILFIYLCMYIFMFLFTFKMIAPMLSWLIQMLNKHTVYMTHRWAEFMPLSVDTKLREWKRLLGNKKKSIASDPDSTRYYNKLYFEKFLLITWVREQKTNLCWIEGHREKFL